MKHWPIFSVVLFIVAIVWVNITQGDNNTTRWSQTLPQLTLITASGDTINTAQLKGQLVYVYFWASWCNNCRKQNKQQIELYEKLRQINMRQKKQVVFIGISLDDSERLWRIAVAQDDLHWPHNVCDTKGWKSKIIEAFGVKSIPSNFIYDTAGVLVQRNVWGNQLDTLMIGLNSRVSN